ncbi:FAD/NAD(P)-binding domain-containing protein [Heliocybe sulcata]|uniref:FAD/NAD(P)-binding domain-containing protein n=1 Tax=Heliocybe sulcata TaxID=5364 RepID=A0A5C3MV66_9AGAM|nr:FAD/NAD(P)-binding domain-containing protein [Heliocybe sulcata]
MDAIGRLSSVLSALFSSSKGQTEDAPPKKAIAIVGAGTGGIGALKALLDLPEEVREGWKIDVLEQTAHVGGMWVPEPNPPPPPDLPNTPLYPALRTNTPHPTMTYPNFPFPPSTPLYPSHSALKEYHEDYVVYHSLIPYIRFKHAVLSATYSAASRWTLTIRDSSNNTVATFDRRYDHLIVAKGNNHYPNIPIWPGQDEWLHSGSSGTRQILHSLWYREPDVYKDHVVVVIGDGASGRDMAAQTLPFAKEVYHSYDAKTLRPIVLPPVPGVTLKPRISHFTRTSIVFTDGTVLETPDDAKTTVLLGTGFDTVVPWLPQLTVSPNVDSSTTSLATNRRYIRPLFRHVLSLDPSIPSEALAFVGLPLWISNAPSDYAQGLLVAHAIADPSWLGSREELMHDLNKQEDALRLQGINPYRYGHAFATEIESEAYLNGLIDLLRSRSPTKLPAFLSDPATPYMAPWRRHAREQTFFMRRGWLRAQAMGVERQFYEGARAEAEWVERMRMLEEWTREMEEREGRIKGVVEEPL